MTAVLYTGEAGGARVFRYGEGIANATATVGASSDYQLDVTTWDLVPAGDVGDVVFRSIDASFTCTNGYSVGITPLIDGVAQSEQTFSGAGSGERQAQAFFAARGTRIAVRFRTLTRLGDLELHTLSTSHWVVRVNP